MIYIWWALDIFPEASPVYCGRQYANVFFLYVNYKWAVAGRLADVKHVNVQMINLKGEPLKGNKYGIIKKL